MQPRLQLRITGLQGGNQGGEEAYRFVVRWLKREPDHRDGRRGQPVGEQGGFAEASRSRKQGQWPLQALLEALDQTGTMHQLWTWAWNVEFGGQQRVGRQMGERR